MLQEVINRRLREFERLGTRGTAYFDFKPFLNLELKATIKTELAFCISTANSSATSGLKFQKSLENINLDNLTTEELEDLLRKSGVRFYKRKALYIKKAIENFDLVKEALKLDSNSARNLLLKVKGLGYKEASHFLRNTGRKDVAIIDRHVLKWLYENGYISTIPKNLSKKKYLEIEDTLRNIASEKKISLAELDLIIWHEKTKAVLK